MIYDSQIIYFESTPNVNCALPILLISWDSIKKYVIQKLCLNSGLIRPKFGSNFVRIMLRHNNAQLN